MIEALKGNRALRRLAIYGLASIAALAVDMAAFMGLVTMHMAAPGAATLGYATGIAVHWHLSSRIVFAGRVADGGKRRVMQRGVFVLTAVAGLCLTWGIVAVGTALGLLPLLSKLVSVVVSFVATYLLRLWLVFPAVVEEGAVER